MMHYDELDEDIKNEFKLQLAEPQKEPIIQFTKKGYEGTGQIWDKLLSDFIKNPNTNDETEEARVAKELIIKLQQTHNGLEFLYSKFPLFGFMRNRENEEKKMSESYLWRGEADAIACYHNKYTIVDFKVVFKFADYRKNAVDLYGKHLHQCLIYARLLQMHMSLDYLPPVLIVVIHKSTGRELYPPLFKDYPKKCKDHIEYFQWSLKPPLNKDKNENLFRNSDFEGTVSSDRLLKDLFKSEATEQDLLDAIARGS